MAYRFPMPSETFVLDHALAFLRNGIDVTIACEHEGVPWDRFDPSIGTALAPRTVRLADPGAGLARSARILASSRRTVLVRLMCRALSLRLGKLARRFLRYRCEPLGRFDVILAHFGEMGVVAKCMRDAGLISGPIATVIHGYDISRRSIMKENRQSYPDLFANTELLLPVSELWRERLIALGADPERTVVHHMGVDLAPTLPVRSAQSGSRELKLVSVGRLVEKKGHKDAIVGFARSGVPGRLAIVGTGPLERELRTLAQHVAPGAVEFAGELSHGRTLSRVADADVFILPSVAARDGDMEGIPVALMEAMALGTIVIATRHSANAELIVDRECGFLVDENAPDQISSVLQELAAGKHDLPAIRRAAFLKVSSEFNKEALNRQLIERLTRLAREQTISAR